ncbi:MAG: hypothetical protein V3V50_07385 [Gammaproteobacteria bacterium]
MILKISFDDQIFEIDVADEMITEARGFYEKLDADMDKGWQMSRTWVEKPDVYQRCQIVADKILGAFHTENKKLLLLMSGYILMRVPTVSEVMIDTSGDTTLTEIVT